MRSLKSRPSSCAIRIARSIRRRFHFGDANQLIRAVRQFRSEEFARFASDDAQNARGENRRGTRRGCLGQRHAFARIFAFARFGAGQSVFDGEFFRNPARLNVGYGEDISIRDLALLMREIVGFEGDLSFDASKPDGTPRKLMDVDAHQRFGLARANRLARGRRQHLRLVRAKRRSVATKVGFKAIRTGRVAVRRDTDLSCLKCQ